MKQLNIYFLFQIAILKVQNKYQDICSTLIEQSPESHPRFIFLVRFIIETLCIIFHYMNEIHISLPHLYFYS